MLAKNAVWKDITLYVHRTMINIIEDFIKTGLSYEKINNDGEECVCLDIFVDDEKFSININTKNEVKYTFDSDTISIKDFMEMLDVYIYSAKTVCYQVDKTCHFDDMTIKEFEKEFPKYLENIENNEVLRTDVYKYQTFTTMEVDKSKNDKKICVTNSVANIVDTWDSDGEMIDNMIDMAIAERPDVFYERFWTSSIKRIINEQKRILRTIEYNYKSQISFLRITRKCIMNLKNPRDHVYRGYTFSMLPEVVDDYYRYANAANHAFLEELVQVAWKPSRYQDWCLDDDEKVRIASYRQT